MKSDIGPIWKLVISVHSFIHRLEFDLINKAGAEWRAIKPEIFCFATVGALQYF